MNAVTLPPDLELFATEAVAAGRYQNVADVVAAGVGLLQRQEAARAELLASVLAAEQEAERDGCVTGDDMLVRVRARLADMYSAGAQYKRAWLPTHRHATSLWSAQADHPRLPRRTEARRGSSAFAEDDGKS